MSEEVNEAAEPAEVVESTPEPQSETYSETPQEAAPEETSGDSLSDEVEIAVDGRVEKISRAEYEYLAQVGAKSLIASQQSQAQPEAAEPAEGDSKAASSENEPSMPDPVSAMTDRITSLEQQLHNTVVNSESEKIRTQVEKQLNSSPVFKAMGQLDESDGLLNEVRREIYNKAVQDNITSEKAFGMVEDKYSQVIGGERQKWLTKKLTASASAVEGTGGKAPGQTKPLSAKDWRTGDLLKSITARLASSE
mgnify:CR=1 FL=1|tara:strand:- start:43 stop:795 length:753 start_codon:yes stop_codon:yes gene_type:complete